MNEMQLLHEIEILIRREVRRIVREELNKERVYQLYGVEGGRVDTFQP